MIRTISMCLELLTARERRYWALLAPIAGGTALVEAAAATMVYGLIALLSDPAARLPGARSIGGWLPAWTERPTVETLIGAAIGLYFVRSVFLILAAYARARVVNSSAVGLTQRLLDRYLRAPYAFHLRSDSATLIRKITDSVDTSLRRFLQSVVSLVTEIFVVCAILVILVTVAPLATMVVAAACAVLVAVGVRATSHVFTRFGREETGLLEANLRGLQQSLGAIKEIKVLGREDWFRRAFVESHRTLWRLRRDAGVLGESVRTGMETAAIVGLLLVSLFLATRRGAGGGGTLPLLALYAYAGFRVIPAANRILMFVELIRFGQAAVHDLHADIRALPAAAPEGPATGTLAFTDAIAFDRVSYRYGEDRGIVLRDISLTIRRGQSVGIVGPTGAGKTTLVDLLLGLLDPTAGKVTIDGRDLRESVRGWQAKIGYVPQHPFLLDDSLRRNIAFGVSDGQIDEARVAAAVRAASLDEFVASLPEGLGTRVGERGARLSGGERQRVAIARALYRGPEVLVLDEATSALDGRTERDVTSAIEAMRGAMTVIVVAHRLSTMRRCDRLVYLGDGGITGQGTFDELERSHEGFRALAHAGP